MSNPNTLPTLLQKGVNLIKSKRYAEAIAVFDDVLALAPKDECARIGKALSLHLLGDYPEAIAAYDQVLLLNPTNAHIWNLKGVALSRLNRYKEAIVAYDWALSINSVSIQFRSNWNAAFRNLENRNKDDTPPGTTTVPDCQDREKPSGQGAHLTRH